MKASTLVVGSLNCHEGTVIQQGGLAWAMHHHPRASLWFLQEVMSRRSLETHINLEVWGAVHATQLNLKAGSMLDSVILYKKSRFRLLGWEAEFNGHGERTKTGKPRARYSTVAVLYDKVTDRDFLVGSMHNAPLGKGFAHAPTSARHRHTSQIDQYIDWFNAEQEHGGDGEVSLLGGDWNEDLGVSLPASLQGQSAAGRLARVNMQFVHAHVQNPGDVGLDDVAYGNEPYIEPTSRQTFHTPAKGEDHPGVIARFRIQHAA